MTTVAANRKVMSADSFVASGDGGYYSTKIEIINDTIVGCAGPSDWCRAFMAWRRGDRSAPKFGTAHRFEALVLNQFGLYVYENDCLPNRVLTGTHAIGSGRIAATAILLYGGTPAEAVDIACKLDPQTKPPIQTLKLPRRVKN